MSMIVDFKKYKDNDRWLKMKDLDNVKTVGFNACMGVKENCTNPDSFGMICVSCNQCRRFNEEVNT